jgi:tetratricopeptide (TPR) repeat protein
MLLSQPLLRALTALIAAVILLALSACDSPEERAQSYYEKGMALLNKGDPVKASLEFRNALKADENFIPALYSLGLVQERMGHFPEAAKLFFTVTEREPDHIESRLQLATLLLMSRQTDEALKFADQAYAKAPNDPQVLALKGTISLRLDNRGEAVRFAEAALKVDPTNVNALIVLAGVGLADHDPKGALAFLAKAGEADDRNLAVQILRVKAYESLKDKEGLEQALVALAKGHPEQRGFRAALVKWYLAAGRTNDAERTLREFAKERPDDVQAEIDLVEFLRRVKNIDAAQEELRSRIDQKGDNFPYKMALASLTLAKGEYGAATKLMRDLIAETNDLKNADAAKLLLARMLIAHGDNAEAIPLVDAVLSEDEKNVDALILRANMKMTAGDLEGVIGDLNVAFNAAPQSPEVAAMLADAYERNGAVALAEEQYDRALSLNTFKPEVGLSYANFLLRYGKTEKAEKILTQTSNAAPNNRAVLAMLAQVQLSTQNWLGAQKTADALRTLGDKKGDKKDDAVADQIIARVLAGENKFDESVRILESGLEGGKNQGATRTALVQTYLKAGKPEKAEEFLKGLLTENPDDVQALILLGSVYRFTKKPAEAEEAYKSVIEKDPRNPTGYAALGELYLATGDAKSAEEILQEGLKQQPQNNALRLQLAMALQRAQDYDGAISEYETLFAADPRATVVANNLASLLSEYRGDPESLERAFTIASRFKGSEVPQFLDTLGWIYYLRHDYDRALSIIKNAAEKVPNFGIYQYHLGMIYKKLDQPDRAQTALKKALDLLPEDSKESEKSRTALNELTSAEAEPDAKPN